MGGIIFVFMLVVYGIVFRKIIEAQKHQKTRYSKDSVTPIKNPPSNQPLSKEEQERRKEMIRNRMNGAPDMPVLVNESIQPPAHTAPPPPMQRIAEIQNRIDEMGYRPPAAPKFRELEDRQNDWLARQIREERAYNPIVDDMLNLKLEHARDCDAEELKRYFRRT